MHGLTRLQRLQLQWRGKRMDEIERKTEYIVQYKVRERWHNYYSYSTDIDAIRSIEHTPDCIKERTMRIVERTISDSVILEVKH
jgi:hypothetical protein